MCWSDSRTGSLGLQWPHRSMVRADSISRIRSIKQNMMAFAHSGRAKRAHAAAMRVAIMSARWDSACLATSLTT